MVQQARRKPNPGNISYWKASAEALPLRDNRADLVFMSMVYHHLGNPAAAARECHRVLLRDGGYVCIRNGTRESDFPHRHFFALQPLIDTELPARAEIAATFESAGFARVTHQVVRQTIAPDWPSFVEKSALRGDSFLVRLSNTEFRAGMDALQAYADRIDASAPVTEEIDWFVFARYGSRDAVSKPGTAHDPPSSSADSALGSAGGHVSRQFRLNEDRDRYREDDPDVTFDAGRSLTSATLSATGIVHHTALLPLSEGSVAIDHVLRAMNHRSLRADEARTAQVNFRRLPMPRNATTSPR
jgi:hypothetical protein